MTLWQMTLLSVLAGFLIDCVLGDPAWLPHPVVLIGKGISLSEKVLRRIFPQTDRGALAAGTAMAILVPLLSAPESAFLHGQQFLLLLGKRLGHVAAARQRRSPL